MVGKEERETWTLGVGVGVGVGVRDSDSEGTDGEAEGADTKSDVEGTDGAQIETGSDTDSLRASSSRVKVDDSEGEGGGENARYDEGYKV